MNTTNDFLKLNGRVALVTGSTRGIGRAIAELFAECGASVIVNGRSETEIERCVAEMRGEGHAIWGGAADVGDSKAVGKFVADAAAHFGRIDVLVNNAGIVKHGSIEDITEAEWDELVRTNLKGMFNVSKAVIPLMKRSGGGSIVNVASQAAVSGSISGGVHYAATKGGVIAFTRGLAKELGEHRIRVNAVMPGLIRTAMTERLIDSKHELYARVLQGTALHRHGMPDEIAAACAFLASDASSYITGETLAVNGGLPSMLFL